MENNMDKVEKSKKQTLSTYITADTKEKLITLCEDKGMSVTDAVETSILDYLTKLASEEHPRFSGNIAFVRQALQGVVDQYLSAVSAAEKSEILTEERIQMATEELRSANHKLKLEVEALTTKGEHSEKNVANALKELQIVKEKNEVLKSQNELLLNEKGVAIRQVRENDSIRDENAKLKKNLDLVRSEKDKAYKKLASITEKYISKFSDLQMEKQSLYTRCEQLEKALTDAGITIPQDVS